MTNGRFHRFSLAVMLAFAAPSFCAASSLAELGTLHQTLVGEENFEVRPLIVTPVESGERLEPPEKTAAAQDVFPTVDTGRVKTLFAFARWDFHPDGTFRIVPVIAPVAETLALTGTYRPLSGAIEIHAARKVDGLVISLDGILRESEGGYRVEAVYSLLINFSAHWLAELRQEIHPGVPPPPSEAPVTWIEGIPVPSRFEVTLRGRMDGIEVPEGTGLLSFSPAGGKYLGPMAIDLDIRSPVEDGPGTFFWQAPPAGAAPERARVTVRDGAASVEVTPRPGDPLAPFWIATTQVVSGAYADLALDAGWGRLDLKVLGDEVAGELRVTTEAAGGSKYQGTFEGRRIPLRFSPGPPARAAAPLEAASESALEDLVGGWELEDGAGARVGDLSLWRGQEAAVEGRVVSAGRDLSLAGSGKGGLLELVETGTGSLWRLRLLRGNELLAGFEYGDGAPVRVRVARRSGRPAQNAGLAASTPEELLARFTEGVRLGGQGRCAEATGLLEEVFLELPQLAESQAARMVFYEGAQLAALFLASCDLQAGDHDGFLRHLRSASQALKPMREAERSAAVESIDILRTFLDRFRGQWGEIAAGFDRLCKAQPADSANGSARWVPASVEIDSLAAEVDARIADLEKLRQNVIERRFSLQQSAAALRPLRQELLDKVHRSFARIAAASQEELQEDRRLLEARDKLWVSADLLTAGQAPDEDALQKHAAPVLDGGGAGALQAYAGFLLVLLGVPLQEEMVPLSHGLDIAPAVQVATNLAAQPEDWRKRFSTDQGKIAALQRLEPFFADLIFLLLEEGEVSDALAVSEIARSRAFVDLLAGRDEIRQYLDELSGRSGDGVLPSPTTVAPPALDDVLETVRRRGSTTVEYFLAEDRVVLWVVSPEGKVFADSEPIDRAALRSTADELHALLEGRSGADGGPAPPDAVRTRQLLRELHRLLIDPIPADRLPQTAEEALTIIPHQELFAVPFAALEDEQGRRLIERHPIVYGTSIASLGAIQRNRSGRQAEAPLHLLALVNPSPLPGRSDGGTFPPLDELEQGFSRIAGIYPAQERMVLKREAATLEALRDHSAGAGVLHLVTHAEFVERDPLASFIALAGKDGALRVPEVFRLDLAADLVILWACETGRGGLSADGVEGLSRGFTWAGASSLLLSLWEIPDTESLLQMEGFHRFWLQQGFPKARALQRAQVEYSRLYPDQPGLWAGLVLYGEAE